MRHAMSRGDHQEAIFRDGKEPELRLPAILRRMRGKN